MYAMPGSTDHPVGSTDAAPEQHTSSESPVTHQLTRADVQTVLETVDTAESPQSIPELADATGLPLVTVKRVLCEALQRGLLESSKVGQYRVPTQLSIESIVPRLVDPSPTQAAGDSI